MKELAKWLLATAVTIATAVIPYAVGYIILGPEASLPMIATWSAGVMLIMLALISLIGLFYIPKVLTEFKDWLWETVFSENNNEQDGSN